MRNLSIPMYLAPLCVPLCNAQGVEKWQRLAEHRWEMYQQTRYRLLP